MSESRASFLSIRISIVREWRERPRSYRCDDRPRTSFSWHWRAAPTRPTARRPPRRPKRLSNPQQHEPTSDPNDTRRRSRPTTAFSSTSTATPVLSGNVDMRQGDKVIRADHLEYDAETSARNSTAASSSPAPRSTCAATAAPTPRRSARSSKARSSSCRNAMRAERRAPCRWTRRHAHARGCLVHHLPGHRRRLADRIRSASCSTRARATAPAAAPASSSRTCPSSIYPG